MHLTSSADFFSGNVGRINLQTILFYRKKWLHCDLSKGNAILYLHALQFKFKKKKKKLSEVKSAVNFTLSRVSTKRTVLKTILYSKKNKNLFYFFQTDLFFYKQTVSSTFLFFINRLLQSFFINFWTRVLTKMSFNDMIF